MSFSATVPQMRAKSKTVTRRKVDTWANLKRGDRLLAVEKAMGLPAGASQVPIGVIEIVSNRIGILATVTPAEAVKEGFATQDDFVRAWVALHGQWDSGETVRRIEFRHVEEEEL